jgi:hypothetical protein
MQERAAPLIFIHIPRTGGSTLWDIFRAALPGKVRRLALGKVRQNEYNLNRMLERPDDECALTGGHVRMAAMSRAVTRERIISFIRRPRQRVISSWFAFVRIRKRRGVKAREDPDALIEFARVTRFRTLTYLVDFSAEQLARWNDAADAEAHASRIAARIDERIGFIGFLEHFETSVFMLSRQMGWRSAPCYKRRNRGKLKSEIPEETLAELDALVRLEALVYEKLLERRLCAWKRDCRFFDLRILLYRLRCRLKDFRRGISNQSAPAR